MPQKPLQQPHLPYARQLAIKELEQRFAERLARLKEAYDTFITSAERQSFLKLSDYAQSRLLSAALAARYEHPSSLKLNLAVFGDEDTKLQGKISFRLSAHTIRKNYLHHLKKTLDRP